MKKQITQELDCCDKCGSPERYAYKCLNCGATYCYECKKALMVDYPHSVHCSGGGDGCYCKDCDTKLMTAADPLHDAFMEITRMRLEVEAWGKQFEARRKAAEERLARIPRGPFGV